MVTIELQNLAKLKFVGCVVLPVCLCFVCQADFSKAVFYAECLHEHMCSQLTLGMCQLLILLAGVTAVPVLRRNLLRQYYIVEHCLLMY